MTTAQHSTQSARSVTTVQHAEHTQRDRSTGHHGPSTQDSNRSPPGHAQGFFSNAKKTANRTYKYIVFPLLHTWSFRRLVAVSLAPACGTAGWLGVPAAEPGCPAALPPFVKVLLLPGPGPAAASAAARCLNTCTSALLTYGLWEKDSWGDLGERFVRGLAPPVGGSRVQRGLRTVFDQYGHRQHSDKNPSLTTFF